MALSAGTRLGPYEILSALGAGGMGEVYRARDTQLKREVAIKVLPEAFTLDPDRLARFKREAQVLASLNHPNIGAIYGFEESAGVQALVLELVEGSTLADRIGQGSIPLDEALPIARQIAEALEAAHEHGIIHRDLKPANIKLRPDGAAKVLDFGLAKALEPASAIGGDVTVSPTITSPAMTRMGVILGTAAYMSPEQAKGRAADKRSDIWAFGCVLFEMLSGRRAFVGEDVGDTLAAVLRSEPDWTALPDDVPAAIRLLLRRCVERDRKRRLAEVSIASFVINEPTILAPALNAALPAVPLRSPLWRRVIPMSISAIVAGALVSIAAWNLRPPTPPLAITRFAFTLPESQQLTENGHEPIALSPDGAHMAYVSNQRLFLRSMSDLQARPIPGTEVTSQDDTIGDPVFSPDGRSIAFWSGGLGSGAVKRVASTGGTPVTVCPASPTLGMSWGREGIVFGQTGKGIMRVAATGGQPELLVSIKNGLPWGPQILPGGDAVLFTLATSPIGMAGMPVVPSDSWDKALIVVQSLKSGERTTVREGGSGARYLPTGDLLYAVSGTLFAVRFDSGRRKVTGGAIPVVEGVRRYIVGPRVLGSSPFGTDSSGHPIYLETGSVYYTVSDTGSLMYVPGPLHALGVFEREIGVTDGKSLKSVVHQETEFRAPTASQIHVVLNWTEELKQRVPTR